MRELLFRAKRKDTGEWVEGNLITNEQDGTAYIGYIFSVRDGVIEDFDLVEVDPETVCKYAFGLKNGDKVFEHSIVMGHLDDKNADDVTYAEIVWNKYGWATREKYCNQDDMITDVDMELWECVVGNIFENKELLGR